MLKVSLPSCSPTWRLRSKGGCPSPPRYLQTSVSVLRDPPRTCCLTWHLGPTRGPKARRATARASSFQKARLPLTARLTSSPGAPRTSAAQHRLHHGPAQTPAFPVAPALLRQGRGSRLRSTTPVLSRGTRSLRSVNYVEKQSGASWFPWPPSGFLGVRAKLPLPFIPPPPHRGINSDTHV